MKQIEFTPNHIPKSTRIFNVLWGLGLIVLAAYAWFVGPITIPGKGNSSGLTYEGNALIIFSIAAVIGAINLFLTIVDHYDKRDNEYLYKNASKYCTCLAVVLVIVASVIQFVDNQPTTVIIGN
ncbi:hypothetical protein SAMN05216262_11566 [Colwellia chukchiensis]|uniref:Uncharacterized protein n=1 Tax=Colwellia chukchiensis TaxID=641665 RepID=A0A1H7RQD8_9GAMM|nr:hypothetical protein [Colwellia chukchiensis]SEL62395.1 hypothetical protein SAMN05216262_11566 [Colwellia chukchiensis]